MKHSRRTRRGTCLSSIFFLLSLLFGSEILAQESFNQSAEFRIAHGYFQQAQVLYRQGRYESAAGLLEASLEFFPDYSESAYLYARVYLLEQETTWKAIEYLEAAVQSDIWTETEPGSAAAELIRVYVRTGRYRDAQRLFTAIGERGLGGRGSPDLSAQWARMLMGRGELAEAQTFLSEAVRRFPRSPELYTLLAEVLVRRGNWRAAGDVLERGTKEIPQEAELLYQLAVLEKDPARRRQLVEAYLQAGGSDPGAALLGITGGGGAQQRFLDLFFRLGGNTRIGYLDALLDLVDAEEIAEQTRVYTGTRIRDRNRDGYYEQRYEYREGILTRWISDQDQDGIAEVIVDFEDGVPRNVTLRDGEVSPQLEYRFREYPFLESAAFASGSSRREYRMVPYTVRRPVFVSISAGQYLLEILPGLSSDEDSLRQNAYQRTEYSTNEAYPARSVRRVHLLEGRTVRVDELPDSAGNFTRTVFYEASVPVEGVRDLDGDGNPEIRELFRNGRLWKITLDQDGDGMKEFEQIIESGSDWMYWDYNDDGLYDSRVFTGSDGTLVRGFSSGLNGAYNLTGSGGGSR
jgi:tetratricopeptide (TPR) repeat protein